MIKYISFYFSLDVFIRSFNILALIIITPIVSKNSQILITNYTVMFTILMSIFTFSQLGLIPKTTNLKEKNLEFDFSVILVGITPLLIILIIFLFNKNFLYSLACMSAIYSFLYQAYQSGNNIHIRLKKIFYADLVWIVSTITVLIFLFNLGYRDENLRVFSHAVGLLAASLLIFYQSRFALKERLIIAIKKNITLGLWMTVYASLQWFLVYGDKLMLDMAGLDSSMVEIFMMTNVLQLQLLGGLAILKAFKAKLIRLVSSKDYKGILSLANLHVLLSLLGIFACILIYIWYVNIFQINKVNIFSIFIYSTLYFSISILYFYYQLVVFLEKQDAVSRKVIAYLLPTIIGIFSIFFFLYTNPLVIQIGFLFTSISLLIITRNAALKGMLE